jgi:hypothetical protein
MEEWDKLEVHHSSCLCRIDEQLEEVSVPVSLDTVS